MLRKNLSDLPTSTDEEGLQPDADPVFVRPWVEWLREGVDTKLQFLYEPDKPQVADTLTRHSSAGACLKKIALRRDGVDAEPMDDAGLHVTAIGTILHEAWQQSLARAGLGTIHFEVPSTIEDLTSGSADAWLPETRHVLEAKTCGGTKYKKKAGYRSRPEGPDTSHLLQLGKNMMGLDADRGTIVYLGTEVISGGAADKANIDETSRFGVQYTFERSQLQPMVDEWLELLRFVRDHPTDEVGRWVYGEMPKGARLDPNSGAWTLVDGDEVLDSGSIWGGALCNYYCDVVDACRAQFAEGK